MGAVGGEEIMKWEKPQGIGTREEKILVLVRLRPLSENEIDANEAADWECINGETILYRNTLREGSTFPSTYTFDRVFRGDCSTRQVYENGPREIALSVVSGINSSVFAYGQTSSGKTYTMNGITQYTVADIFDYINRHEERAFVLKFSAIEIYNEAVRDLLSNDNTPLRLMDDPERGTIVEKVTEETLCDWNHFNDLVSICEAQRQIGETCLNERSSRSHQILRLTVESSAREFLGKDNSTTLAASVNFIDLAGSERASQALSAGARLKEGCHINRSLLTLSTVIRKLSKGRQGHINYRDSKLTRILQPALGGNARTAIICTLSPARSHVEQTRNTLLFACCAKEVTTKAQVNVVMSDKALVKHLQKELARLESELRTPGPASSNTDYVALLKKKDLQIEKLEKEIKELKKQRDMDQSRIEYLEKLIAKDQKSRQSAENDENTWEDDDIESKPWGRVGSHIDANSRKSNTRNHGKPYHSSWDDDEEPSELDETSPVQSVGQAYDRFNSYRQEGNAIVDGESPNGYCKDVRCIDMEESRRENPSGALSVTSDEPGLSSSNHYVNGNAIVQNTGSTLVTENSEGRQTPNVSRYGVLEQRLNDVQRTIESLVAPDGDEPSALSVSPRDVSSGEHLKLSRSWSCRANLLTSSHESTEEADATPPNGLEKAFPGRPEGVHQRKILPLDYDAGMARLTRNDSQSSIGSASMTQSIGVGAGEEITSVQTFVAGLKEMANTYGKQIASDEDLAPKNVKDVGLDPMQDQSTASLDWPIEFERRQRAIIELWQTCNVPLVHRTYFFLLFKGDSSDSIYMEVEYRRLTFLKETFMRGGHAVAEGRTVTLPSSFKALRHERVKLSKLMQRRLSEAERTRLFQKWGINLGSKQRRLQLANRLWNDTKDANHIAESAAIIAKLVRFEEQGQALKGMLGLSFSSPSTRRRSYGWRSSTASIV